MKHPVLVAIIVVVLLAACALGFYILSTIRSVENGTEPTRPLFPSSGTNSGTAVATRPVPTQTGGTLTTRDFINNGTTIEDPSNPGAYYLAGSPGYCPEGTNCPDELGQGFIVTYFPEDGSFIVALTEEPLREARERAERFLLSTLGISSAELCSLNAYVTTDAYTNERFAGASLGFSICSNAVQLP